MKFYYTPIKMPKLKIFTVASISKEQEFLYTAGGDVK